MIIAPVGAVLAVAAQALNLALHFTLKVSRRYTQPGQDLSVADIVVRDFAERPHRSMCGHCGGLDRL